MPGEISSGMPNAVSNGRSNGMSNGMCKWNGNLLPNCNVTEQDVELVLLSTTEIHKHVPAGGH